METCQAGSGGLLDREGISDVFLTDADTFELIIINGFNSTDPCIPVFTAYSVVLAYLFMDEFWYRSRRRGRSEEF